LLKRSKDSNPSFLATEEKPIFTKFFFNVSNKRKNGLMSRRRDYPKRYKSLPKKQNKIMVTTIQ